MQASPAFPREITDARFYYLDKFLLLLCGNTLYLYKYHVDTAKPDDIKRYEQLLQEVKAPVDALQA